MFAYTYSLSNIPQMLVHVRVNILVALHVPVDVHIQMLNLSIIIFRLITIHISSLFIIFSWLQTKHNVTNNPEALWINCSPCNHTSFTVCSPFTLHWHLRFICALHLPTINILLRVHSLFAQCVLTVHSLLKWENRMFQGQYAVYTENHSSIINKHTRLFEMALSLKYFVYQQMMGTKFSRKNWLFSKIRYTLLLPTIILKISHLSEQAWLNWFWSQKVKYILQTN